MKTKMKFVLVMFVAAAVCSSSFGATVQWHNINSSTNWSTAGNWYNVTSATYGTLPTSADYVQIGESFGYGGTVVVDVPAVANHVQVGSGAGDGLLDVQNALSVNNSFFGGLTSGTATINMNSASGDLSANNFYVGYSAPSVLNMSNGSVTANLFTLGRVGTGTLDMSGGTITANTFRVAYSTGHIGNAYLSDGVINTSWLSIGAAGGAGTLTFSDSGKVVINNSLQSVEEWKTEIDLMLGTQILNAQCNIAGDTVEITPIPEPATLVTLALGGLVLRRRKR